MSSTRTNFSDTDFQVKRGEMCVGCRNRSYPGFLRLDSTGEISSSKTCHSFQNKIRGKGNPSLYQSHCGLSSASDNFNKNPSMMRSFGADIVSAAAYLGNLCPQKPMSKGLSSKMPSNSYQEFPVGDLDKMDSVKNHPATGCSGYEKPVHWTADIFGVIHSSLINNCTSNNVMKNHTGVQKYVPPQRRCEGTTAMRHPSTPVDPKLTPYNARLLQKSKQFHTDGQKSLQGTCSSQTSERTKISQPCRISVPCVMRNSELSVPTNSTKLVDDTNSQTSGQEKIEKNNHSMSTSLISPVESDAIEDNETVSTDWFEYDSSPVECAPLQIEKCVSVTDKNNENVQSSQGVVCSDYENKQLRNWYSIENDGETKKQSEVNSDESSQTRATPESVCDNKKTENDVNELEVSKQKYASPKPQKRQPHKDTQLIINTGIDKKNQPSSVEQKEVNVKVVNDSAAKEALLAALYIRNCGKRNRPSAKKRRRHKSQQNNEASENCANKKTENKNELNSSNAHRSQSVVAFILGHDSDNEDDNDSHTVRFHCDFDSDSDWSDNDSDFTDENLSSLDDDDIKQCDLGFRCTDPLMFRMSCSVRPSVPVSQEEDDSSSIDKINMKWKIHVSVETELPKKKSKSNKQVHFADPKSLATIHPMITWWHAYQTARKGPWEQYARDRARFSRRVAEAENTLKPILQQEHRDRIFNDRYADSC